MKRSRIGPKSFADALAKAQSKPRNYTAPRSLARKVARDEKRALRGQQRPKGKGLGRGKGLRAKPDSRLAVWSRAVKKRDNNQCQWPAGCQTGDTRIDAHHIAERSLRPDLKYSVENGIALCRIHHDWLPLNRAAAIALKLLSDETYEKARKAA